MAARIIPSKGVQSFAQNAPEQSEAWFSMLKTMSAASALDPKTSELVYLAVLAALRIETGAANHAINAKKLGATRDEVIGAVLTALPMAGNVVFQALPVMLDAYDAAEVEDGAEGAGSTPSA